jgi:tetratricopeptide (TPR) repeat protein
MSDGLSPNFGAVLRRFRIAADLSQDGLAERAQLSSKAISALERGARRAPYNATVAALARALGLSEAERGELEAARGRREHGVASPGITLQPTSAGDRTRTRFATFPSARNPYFTGREDLLQQVRGTLQECRRVALSGLGGVGKTQVALEYAYRHSDAYDQVFWIRAETESMITSDFVEIADLLEFPERSTTEEQRVVAAVRRWLETHERWLLIADNLDEPRLLRTFLPCVVNGHLLVTSRAQVLSMLGITNPMPVRELSPDEALRFLLARTGRNDADPSERAAAQTLGQELGYLPLALEQAAAYIHDNGSRFDNYVKSYRKRRLALLARGVQADDPTKSVTTTWQIAFDRIGATPASADLLRASAFLSPDRIPLELVMEGATELGPAIAQALPDREDELALDALLAPLTRYSLIWREPASHSYGLHRLVQEVTRDTMDGETRRTWVERVVPAVNRAFPVVEYASWTQCERLLAHAQAAAQLVESYDLASEPAARLLYQSARYLHERARYAEAEPLYRRARAIDEANYGPDHPEIARTLNNLAELLRTTNRLAEAELLVRRALAIDEASYGPDHPEVARALNTLARLLQDTNRLGEAEPLMRWALAIDEASYGPDHPNVAIDLNNLAWLLKTTNRVAEAEPLVRQALAIDEASYGPDHPNVARELNDLGELLRETNRLAEAEPLYRRALKIREKALSPDHPTVAACLNNLALLLQAGNRLTDAEPLMRRALAINEASYGPDHPEVAKELNNIAVLLYAMNRLAEAEPLYRRALEIRQKALVPDHPDIAASLNNLAEFLRTTNRLAEAEPLVRRALAIDEASPWSNRRVSRMY